jgi:hypothetical protein
MGDRQPGSHQTVGQSLRSITQPCPQSGGSSQTNGQCTRWSKQAHLSRREGVAGNTFPAQTSRDWEPSRVPEDQPTRSPPSGGPDAHQPPISIPRAAEARKHSSRGLAGQSKTPLAFREGVAGNTFPAQTSRDWEPRLVDGLSRSGSHQTVDQFPVKHPTWLQSGGSSQTFVPWTRRPKQDTARVP